MDWKSSAKIKIRFETEKQVESIFKALEPESKKSPTTRSKVEIMKKKRDILLIVRAKDIVALRAALNSHLRFLKAWKKIIKIIETENFE